MIPDFDIFINFEMMDEGVNPEQAVNALAALAQEHRLAIFRLLVQAGEDGLAAGAIADALDLPPSSLSFHLAQLHSAGMVARRREHRSIIYAANYLAMNKLIRFLTENCCAGGDCSVLPQRDVTPAWELQ